MKKIVVNEDACIGCGACVAIDSSHFAFNDEGLSHAISNENLESEELLSAIESCPTSAISIIEETDVNGEQKEDEYSSEECECEKKKSHESDCQCSNYQCEKKEAHGCDCQNKKEETE